MPRRSHAPRPERDARLLPLAEHGRACPPGHGSSSRRHGSHWSTVRSGHEALGTECRLIPSRRAKSQTGVTVMAIATKRRADALLDSIRPFLQFFNGPIGQRLTDPSVANFAVGNPQEMPLPGYVSALQRHLIPQDKDWFAYKLSEPAS